MHKQWRPRRGPTSSPSAAAGGESTADSMQEELQRRLAEVRARHPATDPLAVVEVVRAVLSTMSGDLTAREASLLVEVEDLGRTIATAREEIAALQVDDITASHIPTATDELDAVVEHTAMATDTILEVCETLDRTSAELPPDSAAAAALQAATTQIYEACSFQDITGQRITKVIAALKAIDEKVAFIVEAFGGRGISAAATPRREANAAALLQGPQLPAAAMGQGDIDKLLASFE